MIHVVVGIVINEEGKILIAERKKNPELWEFPGGKIESYEDSFTALQRELQEEVGITVISAKNWFTIHHAYPDKTVSLNNWIIHKYTGSPHGAEGQKIRWVLYDELSLFKFPDANISIIEKLRSVISTASI